MTAALSPTLDPDEVVKHLDPAAYARFKQAVDETADLPPAERVIVLTTTLNYLTDTINTDMVGTALKAARVMEVRARIAAKTVAKLAIEDGATEHGTAKLLGVDRMAVRKWLGKK